MPAERVSSSKKKSTKKGRFGLLSAAGHVSGKFTQDRFREIEEIATGIPPGVVMLAHALDQALPASPIPGVDEGHVRNTEPLKQIGKQSLLQMKEDLRHPLRNPTSTALTLGGLASLGTGTVARGAAGVSAASKGAGLKGVAKAAARPKPPIRKIKSIQKPTPTVGARYKMHGKWIEKAPTKTGRKSLAMQANRNPLVRGARKITLDPLYERSAAKAAKTLARPRLRSDAKILQHGSKEYKKVTEGAKTELGILRKARAAGFDAIERGDRIQPVNKQALHPKQSKSGRYAKFVERRTMDQRKRYSKQLNTALNPVEDAPVPDNIPGNLLRAPLDLMRLSMYVRPRYYVQNLGGTVSLLAHAGIAPRHIRTAKEIRKNDPEFFDMLIAAGGETATSSISMGTSGGGRLGRTQQRAAHKANRPEAHLRTLSVIKAAEDFGVTDPIRLKTILKKPDSNEAQLIMQRANEKVVDYSRVGGSSNFGKKEKAFVRSGIPIFYPMTKGFSRYAARFPTEYPLQSALLSQLGQQGKEFQREGIGGEPQPWFPYITPLQGEKTQNLQNIYNFSPGADVVRQAAQMMPGAERHPTLNLAQQFGPLGELVHGAITGRQLATGFEYDKDMLDALGTMGTATLDTAHGIIPFADLAFPRSSAAFGEPDFQERLKLWAAGPGFVQRKTDIAKVRQPRKKKKKHKKTSSKF